MNKFLLPICFFIACEQYIPSENDSTWMDLVKPQEMEDEPDCLHCSELRRTEDYEKACTSAKQLANMIAKCQCATFDDHCPNECGWLDYLTPECAQGINYNACEDYWILCEKDKPQEYSFEDF